MNAAKQLAGAVVVTQWNAQHPAGTRVRARLDDGTHCFARTLGLAEAAADGTAVIRLAGINGWFPLARVEAQP